MVTIRVRPELLHLAAVGVRAAGEELGRACTRADAEVSGKNAYGADELGAALAALYEPVAPKISGYSNATGLSVIETARGVDRMATCYTSVERDNTDEVNEILDELGRI